MKPHANDTMSRVASRIRQLQVHQPAHASWEMSALGAPSECWGLISAGWERQIDKMLAGAGFTRASWNAAAIALIGNRAAHDLGLLVEEPDKREW